MLRHIQSFSFFLLAHANSHDQFDQEEDSEREDEGEEVNTDHADKLGQEIGSAKNGNSKRSPDTDRSVNRDRTDRIVNLDLV